MKRLIAASAIFAGLCVPLVLAGEQSSAATSPKPQTQTMHKKMRHKKHHRSAKQSTKMPNQPTSAKKS